MEIIGVYFVNKLEEKLQENFMSSIKGRVTSLGYFIREAMSTEETNEDSRKKYKIY